MFFAITFTFWRLCQIITLICNVGMMAWFVDIFNSQNMLTPNFILVMFIVSVIALAWTIFTLFSYRRSSANGLMIAWTDILFMGAFIAAVYYQRHIGPIKCSSVSSSSGWRSHFAALYQVRGVHNLNPDSAKPCAMIKTAFAFGIMNVIFFFITAVAAWIHGDSVHDSHFRGNVTHVHRSSVSHSRPRSHSQRSYSRDSRRRSSSRHGDHRRSYSQSRVNM
ncbi:hypothetical protein CFIMG_005229RA [Ceratocystis fimbriata CBS 114723]|uniref:MARVEL domain-containing protein n=2 Tax=Ceratocystis TaxID=5157 RepID=A0A2C5WZ45_9PEZI|nr:hypothetical protein CFIMG_005229RA [Ceratocystis fimbriata CBS 114723]